MHAADGVAAAAAAAATTTAAAATTAAGIAAAQEALRAEAPPHEQPHALSCLSPRERRLVSLLYPVTAAVVAGWTPLLVKQALLLLGAAFGGDHTVWSYGATYCILGAVLCSAPLQLTCLAKGLRYVEAPLVARVRIARTRTRTQTRTQTHATRRSWWCPPSHRASPSAASSVAVSSSRRAVVSST